MNLTVLYCLSWLIGIFFAEVYLSELCMNCANGVDDTGGCLPGWYGNNCSQPCIGNCFNNTCIMDTGLCFNCPVGYTGSVCNETCPDNCGNTGCERDGTCKACENGYYGNLCKQRCSSACFSCFQNNGSCVLCQAGLYGVNCEKPCSDKCDNQDCDKEGHCYACADPNFHGNECDTACNSTNTHCVECISLNGDLDCIQCSGAKFGKQCENDCSGNCELCASVSHCTKCAAGYSGAVCDCTIAKCLECDLNGFCKKCEPGLYGQHCDKICFECKTCKTVVPKDSPFICLSCYEGEFLNDNICLPCPNNCFKCSNQTECLLCIPGYYGKNCTTLCPVNCLPDPTGHYVCDGKDGTCSGDCRDGFYEDYCNLTCIGNCGFSSGHQGCNKWSGECFTCSDGYYGQFCNLTCGANCGPASGRDMCERDTGNCASCDPKFYGSKCENHCSTACEGDCDQETGKCEVCVSKRYGDYCTRLCPEHCGPAPDSGKVVCHKQSAECLYCQVGFYGERCLKFCEDNCARSDNIQNCEKSDGRCKGCIDGFYGEFCKSTCDYCKNKVCDQNTGHCTIGCKTGWFNLTCTERCSSTCKGEECDQLTGVCLGGCVEGYGGQFCKSGLQISCDPKFYGSKCEKHCSVTCEDFCDQETGKCNVCISKRYGDYCTRECPNYCGPAPESTKVVCHKQNAECLYCKIGFYGERCIHNCDNNCARSNTIPSCEKADGRCKGCINGFYGNICDSTCKHCKDKICDQNTGHCKRGCKTGWFNLACDERCSTTCNREECDQLTGVCLTGCVWGYGGQFCKSGTQDQGSVSLYWLAGVAAAVVLLIVSLTLTLVISYKRKTNRRERQMDHGTFVNSLQEPMMSTQRHFTEEETQPTVSCRQEMPQNIPLKQEAKPAISDKQVSRHTDQNTSTDQESPH